MSHDTETAYARSFPRITYGLENITFQLKFFTKGMVYDDVVEAKVINLSENGAQICACLPSLKLLRLLGQESFYIGCSISGNYLKPVKVISRIRWAANEPIHGEACHRLGVEFIKFAKDGHKNIKNYIVHQQIEESKQDRRADYLRDKSEY